MKQPKLTYYRTKINKKDQTANVTIYSENADILFELDVENYDPTKSAMRRAESGEYQCIHRYDVSRGLHWYLKRAYDILTVGEVGVLRELPDDVQVPEVQRIFNSKTF